MKHQFFHLLTFVFAYIMSFDVNYTLLHDHLKNLWFITHLHSAIDPFSTSAKSDFCFSFSQLIFCPKHIICLNSCFEQYRLKCLTIVLSIYIKKKKVWSTRSTKEVCLYTIANWPKVICWWEGGKRSVVKVHSNQQWCFELLPFIYFLNIFFSILAYDFTTSPPGWNISSSISSHLLLL